MPPRNLGVHAALRASQHPESGPKPPQDRHRTLVSDPDGNSGKSDLTAFGPSPSPGQAVAAPG